MLEQHLLSKVYFDPAGLILAIDDTVGVVGFVLAGFGPDESGARPSTSRGVICTIAVQPGHRRQGIGTELLHRAEAYLRGHGASTIEFGASGGAQPYGLGLYGGSEPTGTLGADSAAEALLRKHNYQVVERQAVMQRSLDTPVKVADARFVALRKHYEVRINPRPSTSAWYRECQIGPLEMIGVQLCELVGGRVVGEAWVWDMDPFVLRWRVPAAGIVGLQIDTGRRGLGLGKFLVANLLRYLQEQFFTFTEIHVPADNAAGLALVRRFGFQQIDLASVYRLHSNSAAS
jgi:ribosomal protein S18 acetylase RimI-like enzyme